MMKRVHAFCLCRLVMQAVLSKSLFVYSAFYSYAALTHPLDLCSEAQKPICMIKKHLSLQTPEHASNKSNKKNDTTAAWLHSARGSTCGSALIRSVCGRTPRRNQCSPQLTRRPLHGQCIYKSAGMN